MSQKLPPSFVEKMWDTFDLHAVHPSTDPQNRAGLKLAFYSGAVSILGNLYNTDAAKFRTDEEREAVVAIMQREINAYFSSIEKKS